MSDVPSELGDSIGELSDHELLQQIAMRAEHITIMLQNIMVTQMNEAVKERSSAVFNEDLRLLRRKYVGPRSGDYEDQ